MVSASTSSALLLSFVCKLVDERLSGPMSMSPLSGGRRKQRETRNSRMVEKRSVRLQPDPFVANRSATLIFLLRAGRHRTLEQKCRSSERHLRSRALEPPGMAFCTDLSFCLFRSWRDCAPALLVDTFLSLEQTFQCNRIR